MNAIKHAVTLLLVALFSVGAMTVVQAESKEKSQCVGTIDYDNLTPEEYFDLYQR